MNFKRLFFIPFLSLLIVNQLFASQQAKREFRAVWIATVANIDWPSTPDLSPTKQRIEMRRMLDKLQEANINAIVIQIRPTADSFYPSAFEPWSYYLTGKNGQPPYPFYDPLQFIIQEAHQRCMEVHVWLNPYRVTNASNQINKLDKNHIYYKNRDLIVKYGDKYYFDPGLDETRAFLNNVVKDIVERYDIDGIHFDDYFYPYPIGNKSFPDDKSFREYPRGFTSKADWRRNNVNLIIEELQQTIKGTKPWVQFGVSPFGVWRNKNKDINGSATKAGLTNYDDLYADILKWLKEGDIDYVVPQLYWEIGRDIVDYKILSQWWANHSYGNNVYVGLYASGLGTNKRDAWQNGNELARQLEYNAKYVPEISGDVFFSASTFLKNPKGLIDTLENNYYKYPAIQPMCKNIKGPHPEQPQNLRIINDKNESYLYWDDIKGEGGNKIAYYVVYGFRGKEAGNLTNPANIVVTTTESCVDLKKLEKKLKGINCFTVTAVNKYREESIPAEEITRDLTN